MKVKAVQPLRISSERYVTDLGIVIELRDVQFENAL